MLNRKKFIQQAAMSAGASASMVPLIDAKAQAVQAPTIRT